MNVYLRQWSGAEPIDVTLKALLVVALAENGIYVRTAKSLYALGE